MRGEGEGLMSSQDQEVPLAFILFHSRSGMGASGRSIRASMEEGACLFFTLDPFRMGNKRDQTNYIWNSKMYGGIFNGYQGFAMSAASSGSSGEVSLA